MGAQSSCMRTQHLLALGLGLAQAPLACAPGSAPPPQAPGPVVATTTTTATPAPASPAAGDVHDFDFLNGDWAGRNRRLKARGVGSHDWEEFPGVAHAASHMGGVAQVEEVSFPSKGWSGLTLRLFDVQKKQWSIYWINSRTGLLFPPVVG